MASRQTALSISSGSESDTSSCDSGSNEAELMAAESEFYSLEECLARRYERARVTAERKAELKVEKHAERAYLEAAAARIGPFGAGVSAAALDRAFLEAAAARVGTSTTTTGVGAVAAPDTKRIVTDVHEKLLVVSYRRHYADYIKLKHHVAQQFPFVVWQKVHADFLKKFPGTSFDVALLKTHLKEGLQKYGDVPLPTVSVNAKPNSTLVATAQVTVSVDTKPTSLVAAAQAPSSVALRPATATVAQVPVSVDAKTSPIAVMQAPVVTAPNFVNGAVQAASSDNLRLVAPVVKSEEVGPVAATMMAGAAAAQQPKQIGLPNSGTLTEASSRKPTPINQLDSVKNMPASQNDPNVTVNNDQGVGEDSGQQQQPLATLKRRMIANHIELQKLKKQKLALENLKLELELGVITREESIERGQLLVQM